MNSNFVNGFVEPEVKEFSLESNKSSGFLYHYSLEQYDVLLSKRAQGLASDTDIAKAKSAMEFRNSIGLYVDSISLFLEPAPLDIISKCFKGKHKFWKSGNQLVEHKVSLSDIPDCPWMMSETTWQVGLMDILPFHDDDEYKKQYFHIRRLIAEMMKDIGNDKHSLLDSINRYKGTIRDLYLKIPDREDFDDIVHQYAGTVPHVQIYPEGGKIFVGGAQRVKVK